jgi:hypothetical protein
VPNDAWTATPGNIQKRFAATNGADPIFDSVDGTNCPSLPTATPAEHEQASSLLLTRGLIRIPLTPPAGSQFAVTKVENAYGCTATAPVSVYRRISTTANLAFLSNVMWDGRESLGGAGIPADLVHQAQDAVASHEQGNKIPANSVLAAIQAFESAQFTAQVSTAAAGSLDAAGAMGGPAVLAAQTFTPGANNPFGASAEPFGMPPQPVFTVFAAWERLTATDSLSLARESIGRGEHLFNTLPITITGVAGINDQIGPDNLPMTTVVGTCGTCHNAPNAGSHSKSLLVNTGVASTQALTAGLPTVTLINNTTGATVTVTDPGLALTTGKWADIGKFKVPTLRGLDARAPYFHNGGAATLNQVVGFYNARFNLKLTSQQQGDLVAFLQAL